MPRSRSRSLESITRSPMRSCAAKVPDCFSRQSTSVVLPWSTCAMIAMLRMGRAVLMSGDVRAERAQGGRRGAGKKGRAAYQSPALYGDLVGDRVDDLGGGWCAWAGGASRGVQGGAITGILRPRAMPDP